MTPQQPPGNTADGELLALAAATAADHTPGLHPIDLIVAARYGFTSDQAHAILDSPHLLRRLTRYWHSHPPTEVIIHIAQSGDAMGEAHLKLLHRTGHIIHLRSRSRHALAASTAGIPEIVTDDRSGETGIVVVRRLFRDQGLMDFVIESAHIEADIAFPVVALLSLGEAGPPVTRLLFLLIPTGPGVPAVSHSECRLLIDPALTSDKLVLYRTPIEASDLTGTNLAAVSHSVAVAKLPWKDAWRRAALATPDGHPLRDAVITGLAAEERTNR
jgi:hypothetical protein